MSITAAELLAIVAVRGADEAALKLLGVGASADSAGEKLGKLAAGGILLAGAGLVAIGVKSTQMAADFQQGLTRLKTGAGDVTDNLARLGQGMLKVSIDTGTLTNGTNGLNAAMYLIVSSGQRGAQALETLSVAAKGAKIEQANVVDVANVLSGVMTNYGTKTFNATQFMNGLITAVQHGKITLQDLAVAMGPIDPIAQSLGIHFQDVAAAMTTQTNAMIPAARAATGLRFMMQALENPTKKATTAMKDMGLNSVKLADEMKVSLPGALQMIYDAAKKAGPEGSVPFNRAISDMVGGVRSFTAFTALTGPHMKDFTNNVNMITASMQQNKNAVLGWDTVQSNFNLQMDKGKAALAALAISIGEQLLPYMTQLLVAVTPLITSFAKWVTTSGAVTGAIQNTIGFVQTSVRLYQQWQPEIQNTAIALTVFFTPALIKAGIEAVISAAKITYNFVASLILTGFQGWAAAFKLAAFTASLIATGVQAGISGTIIASRFVISLVTTATTAYATAFALTGSVIPALYAMGVAVTASLGPIGLMIAAVGVASLAFIAMKNKSDEMQLGTTGAFDTMGNKIQRSTGRIIATSDQMKQQVAAQADEMRKRVVESFSGMANQTYSETTTLSQNAVANFQRLNGDLQSQMSSIDANIIGYWNDVAAYISSHQITGTVSWRSVGGPITPGGPAGATTSHNAMGTNFWQGGMTWVGERGPEIINLPRGSQVIPNHQINNVVGSSGSSGQPIQVNINLAGHRVAQVLLPELVQAIRNKTGARI